MKKKLIDRTEVKVRFGEVDSMGIVWHGNYVKYMEDGRESFGEKYGITYLDFFKNRVMSPVVNMNINYLKQVNFGDSVIVETEFVDTTCAKIIFNYRLYRKSDNELVVTAQTTQVFINMNREMLLYPPQFAIDWREKVGLTE